MCRLAQASTSFIRITPTGGRSPLKLTLPFSKNRKITKPSNSHFYKSRLQPPSRQEAAECLGRKVAQASCTAAHEYPDQALRILSQLSGSIERLRLFRLY